MKEISREDLTGFEHLQVFSARNNQLTSLPDDLFINKPKLNQVDLISNKLEYLSSKLLQPIVKNDLKVVDIRTNTRVDVAFWNGQHIHGPMPFGKYVTSIEELMRIIDAQCLQPIASNNPISLESEQKLSFHQQNKLTEGFKKLWASGNLSDFVIIVNGSKEFRVHKLVLAVQSVVFAAMFDDDEHATEMKIEDLSVEAVEEFLCFLYTGNLSKETKNAKELFALSSRLKVEEVKDFVEKIVLKDLDVTNAHKVFTLGHCYRSEALKTAAFEEIRKMFPDKKLADNLIENPVKIKEIIEAKLKFDAVFSKLDE